MPTDEIKQLEKKLKELEQQRADKQRIKQLKKQIKAHQFAQTKTGKFVDVVGGFGSRVGKKLFTPPAQVKAKGKAKATVKDVNKKLKDIINKLPA